MTDFKEKILHLVEEKETEFALELLKGMNDPKPYEALLEGCELSDGVLNKPDWVSWEGHKDKFFHEILEAAPATEKVRNIREGVRLLEYCDHNMTKFPAFVAQFTNLIYLSIRGSFTTKVPEIPAEMANLIHLEDLTIRNLGLTTLCPALENLKKLRRFDLPNNALDGDHSNLQVLERLESLEILVLDGNHLEAFPEGTLSGLLKLKSISLNRNQFSCSGRRNVLPELSRLPKLREIFLDGNGIEEIEPPREGFPELIKLDLGNNELSAIPANVGKLAKLKWLNLEANPIFAYEEQLREDFPDTSLSFS